MFDLNPVDDSWVYRDESGNDGAGNHLKVQKNNKDVYVKFDIGAVSAPAISAELSLTTSREKSGTVHVHAVEENNWEEETITGETAPPFGARLASATTSGAKGEEVSWDVTASVQEAISNGAGFLSLALVMTEGDQVYFYSKENAGGSTAPRLYVEIARENQYRLTVDIIGDGEVIVDPPDGPYDEGTEVTLTAVPAQNCAFNGWSGDVSDFDNPLTIVMSQDIQVIAEFWCPPGDPEMFTATDDSWVYLDESGNDGAGNHLKIQRITRSPT